MLRWGTPTTRPLRIWLLPPWTRSAGRRSARNLNREKVLADYAAGKADFHMDFLRRRKGGGAFWGSTSFRLCVNPENNDIITFFYTFDITEQKLREQLLMQIAALDYDVITEINIPAGIHRLISYDEQIKDTIMRDGVVPEGDPPHRGPFYGRPGKAGIPCTFGF